jgi:uncharacterized OB-fold protein
LSRAPSDPAPEAHTQPAPAPRRRRPRPGITRDTSFFWDGVAQRKLLIQRCTGCKELRHPPSPMCRRCRSLDWDTLEACGRGTIYSFVLHYHPHIPPFEPGHPVAVIELEEGTRLVTDLVGIAPEDVEIGLPVEVEFNRVDDELILPQFRPRSPRHEPMRPRGDEQNAEDRP